MDTISFQPNIIHTSICYKNISRINNTSNNTYHIIHNRKGSKIRAVEQVSAVISDPVAPELTWQIVVGSTAGVIPFVVAGIEFSKRICNVAGSTTLWSNKMMVAQKKCVECGGSGLVLIEKEYIRCPNCGGFLPWQSWKRFFSG
uniref:uncharacterized protein LOC122599317 n=1 Tax=Erigeron canadensis TaxID=72917 RepID=UPI001CB88C50|nr:uncharacterized protein LOC122599317 [Erigeron canadensis]